MNKSNSNLKIILGICVALLVGVFIYAIVLHSNKTKMENELRAEKELVIADLQKMSAQYDQALKDNSAANDALLDAKERIKGLIDSLGVAEANIKNLMVYKSRYAELQSEMKRLMIENKELAAENDLLFATLEMRKAELESRIQFTDSLLKQNSELAKIVTDAKILGVVGLQGYGVIERSSGKLIPTERARRSDKIRVCFTVAKNPIVSSGNQEFYVQVMAPNTQVLGENKLVNIKGQSLKYSTVSTFFYEDQNLDICEFISPTGDKFEEGQYTVNIYNKENLVSTTQFTLK